MIDFVDYTIPAGQSQGPVYENPGMMLCGWRGPASLTGSVISVHLVLKNGISGVPFSAGADVSVTAAASISDGSMTVFQISPNEAMICASNRFFLKSDSVEAVDRTFTLIVRSGGG